MHAVVYRPDYDHPTTAPGIRTIEASSVTAIATTTR